MSFIAAEKGDLEIVKLLINNSNVNNVNYNQQTILHYAVQSKNVDVVRFLLEQGVNIDAKDKYGMLF